MRSAHSHEIWIYHEPQDSALCGQHCLNNLLQHPVFTVGDLADIAEMLDNKEKQYMMEAGAYTADAIRFLAEDSGNVDESGNFSIEVLKCALQNSCNIDLVPWFPQTALEHGEDPSSEMGFIVNRSNHWYSVRRVGENWWDLNSFNPKPIHISKFYLTAYLSQLVEDGYSVFAARGAYPTLEFTDQTSDSNLWYPEASIMPGGAKAGPPPPQPFAGIGRRIGGDEASDEASPFNSTLTDDEQLAHAIALSLSVIPAADGGASESCLSEKEQMRAKRLAALEKRGLG